MPKDIAYYQGTQRRAYAPGAHWNVQVVRGKVATRCLWHACKALGLGLLLMFLGACMATIGYYADHLSIAQEIRGNLTINLKNESRGFHLNNFSYAGPIVMGIGGFIVVAACVMTFEARDSAAKVVPARFRFNRVSTALSIQNQRNRRSTSSQTSKWDHQLCTFRITGSPSPTVHELSRNRIAREFMNISKDVQKKEMKYPIKKSPSAPNLIDYKFLTIKPYNIKGGCAILNPKLLRRYALSVDNPGYSAKQISEEAIESKKLSASQGSMAMDLYIPNKGLITVTVKDRSNTAKRHQLTRQIKIEEAVNLEQANNMPALNRSYSPKLSD